MSTMMSDEPLVQDAAMSLCALGRSCSASPDSPDVVKSALANASLSSHVGNSAAGECAMEGATVTASLYRSEMNLHLDNRLNISDQIPSHLSPLCPPLSSATAGLPAGPTRKKVAPKQAAEGVEGATSGSGKYNVRPKDPKRDTSVPFDEMKRLMRVYGSLKCLRNRTPVDSGRSTKVESIKRKFYRWFPDLEERFVRTPEGWYKPKAGHEEEMKYREAMRKEDQESLVKKRNSKRSRTKINAPSLV